MYIRIYPQRNNTIFKRTAGGVNEVLGLVNTGKNPIFELTSGNTQSTILMNFDISSIKTLLENYPYECNLKLWDAGVLFEPSITLDTIDLVYFREEFIEGDGFQFIGSKTLTGASNWLERVTGTPWSPAQPNTFALGQFPAYQLNEANEDLLIENLSTFVDDAITNNINPNFGIRISTNTVSDQTYTKFIHSRHTKTIFKPYLEFIINDSIVDKRQSAIATESNKVYLLNQTGVNFVGTTVTCEIKNAAGTVLFIPTVNNPSNGVYYVEVTPTIDTSNTTLFDLWSIDGVELTKGLITVQSPNQVVSRKLDGLFFYPITSYPHPSIRQNDVVLFEVISQIRGKGTVLLPGYEYRVVSTSGFEMQPWTQVNIYDNKLFFHVDTSYYFPGLEYEVFVRLNHNNTIKTSNMTYKFRLQEDAATHLRELNASPYNNRDYLFYQ